MPFEVSPLEFQAVTFLLSSFISRCFFHCVKFDKFRILIQDFYVDAVLCLCTAGQHSFRSSSDRFIFCAINSLASFIECLYHRLQFQAMV